MTIMVEMGRKTEEHMRKGHKRYGAFTLVELLISLAILSIVAALAYTSLVSVRRVVDIHRRNEESLRNIRSFVQRLDVELSSATYVRSASQTLFQSKRVEMDGKVSSTLVFTTISPFSIYDIGRREEIIRIEYEVTLHDKDRDRIVLRRKEYPHILIEGSLQEPVEYTVSQELTSFLLRFKKDGKWYESWDTGVMDLLPDSIEMTFSLGGRLFREYFNVYISET